MKDICSRCKLYKVCKYVKLKKKHKDKSILLSCGEFVKKENNGK